MFWIDSSQFGLIRPNLGQYWLFSSLRSDRVELSRFDPRWTISPFSDVWVNLGWFKSTWLDSSRHRPFCHPRSNQVDLGQFGMTWVPNDHFTLHGVFWVNLGKSGSIWVRINRFSLLRATGLNWVNLARCESIWPEWGTWHWWNAGVDSMSNLKGRRGIMGSLGRTGPTGHLILRSYMRYEFESLYYLTCMHIMRLLRVFACLYALCSSCFLFLHVLGVGVL